jgi:antirestriction protein ArdC
MKTSQSVYEAVTNAVIEELEKGTVPWVKPWTAVLPHNAVSQQEYHGVNVLLLWQSAFLEQYENPAWLTFRQAKELGGYVKRDEKATRIVYAARFKKQEENETGEIEEKDIPFLKFYFVFNLEQTVGLPPRLYERYTPRPLSERLRWVQSFLSGLGAKVLHGSAKACYVPALDVIHLPNPQDFEDEAYYCATSLHEHTHWTGAAHRLNRDLSGVFGSKIYAFEEMIAELGAAFLCAFLGIPGRLRHADYLASWLAVLREDKKVIFRVASQATKAAEYLRSLQPEASET